MASRKERWSDMQPLPDYLCKGLDIIFIGYNPSIRSGETGHHYANPNNRFWYILHAVGLTPRRFTPAEDSRLLELGYGLTNIVDRPTRGVVDITKQEYADGRRILRKKLAYYRPKIACFVGKGVYQVYSDKNDVQWGAQVDPVIPGIIDFIAPSSSGLVRIKLNQVVSIYAQLKEILK